jgi:hypothetical protein
MLDEFWLVQLEPDLTARFTTRAGVWCSIMNINGVRGLRVWTTAAEDDRNEGAEAPPRLSTPLFQSAVVAEPEAQEMDPRLSPEPEADGHTALR